VTTTVLCVWVKGQVAYSPDYVQRLKAMVSRQMDRPYRFVCLTDRPWELAAVDTIPITGPGALKGWWSKVRCFDAGLRLSGRLLYLDLDSLIVGPLAPILDYPSRFALVPPGGTFEGKGPLKVVTRFNSSVMVWDADHNHRLFDDWTPLVSERLWGDQDWIGEQMPGADTMPADWFPRISQLGQERPSAEAKVVLMKTPKNAEAAERWAWVKAIWRAA
jgi:hypothetical protein